MNTQNSIFYHLGGRRLVSLLCALLLGVSCTPKINEKARKEAETMADDASATYKKSQQSISFENKYTWQGALEVNDAKTRNEKFLAAAKGLEAARDKFLQASTKMTEALNGQKVFDNTEATRISRTSDAYKRWSDMAEFERKTLQEASAMTDTKALSQKLAEAQEKRDKMNKDLMDVMKFTG